MKTKPTKFVDRVAAAFGFSRMIDAVNHRSEERGWVYAQAQDSKVDLSSYDRTRLMALSRKCFYNNAIVRGAVRDKAMYSVGSGIGIRPQAMSGDQAWDDAAEAWWENWARSPEISGRHDMRSLQMLVSEAIDRDGEIFAVLTAKSDGAPAVQIVESHRIESPDTAAGSAGVVDGVKLDKFQRPLGYFIGEGDEYPRRHREIKADVMLHVYEPERSDQVRGYPAIGVALNSVLDRDELLRFEMMAAKAGSSIGLVIKNSTGNIGAEGFLGDFSKDSNGNLTRESIFGGGLVPRMKNSEDIQSFVMNRPNEKLDKHLEQYIRAAAIGLGLPYEFVWDTSAIGGVAQRFIIQKAARCFAARQDVLVNAFLSKLWRYAIARAISRRELPMVAGWQQVGWQTPRSITVDVGREATARRDDVKAGLMTLSDYFGEQGIDWKEAVAEIAAEREFAADLGVMIGVEQAQPQEEIIPDIAQPEVVMPAAEFSQLIAKLDCGTGAGGFKPGNDCARGGSSGETSQDSDSQKKSPLVAETVKEAEEIAKRFGEKVSYRGMTVEQANEVNAELADFYANHPNAPRLYVIRSHKFSGRFTEEAPAAYRDLSGPYKGGVEGELNINTAILGSPKKWNAYKEMVAQAQTTVDNVSPSFLERSRPELKAKIDYLRSFDRQIVDDSPRGIVRHEMGHHLDYQMLLKKDTIKQRNAIVANRESFHKGVSHRAAFNGFEYVAESYVAHRKGMKIDPQLAEMFNTASK